MAMCKDQNERHSFEPIPVVNEDFTVSGVSEHVEEEGGETVNKKSDDNKTEMDKMKDFMKIQETKLEEATKEMKDIISIVKDQGTQLKQNAKEINSLRNRVIELERPVEKVSNKSDEERLDHLEEMEKLSSVRSCYELEQYGIKTSNTYMIDTDGPLVGEEPYPVFCDFEQHETQITHNREYPVEVEHCEGQYCFKMDIDYGVPMSQLKALIDISSTCTQTISFNCFLAPLSINDNPVGVWVNRHNQDEKYFTGSNSGTHICECGLTNNCTESDQGMKCNCDASNIPTTMEDSGVLTDMAALPVIGFKYGDLIYEGTYASIEVERLICKGNKKVEPENLYDTCENLKLHGRSDSGNFIMNSGKVSFCDFQKDINDPNIEKEIPWMRFNDVMFMVTAAEATYLTKGTVQFDNVIVDLGNNFDISSGTFTAPRTGNYLLIVDGTAVKNHNPYVEIVVNRKSVKDIRDYEEKADFNFNGMLPIILEAGDEVTLTLDESSAIFAQPTRPFSFIGTLASEITTI